jgi:hypothetical protein
MKRLIVLGLMLVGIAALLIAPALAASPTDLNRLASWFPESTSVFASLRTDDAYIQTWDSLIERLKALPDTEDIQTLSQILDQAVQDGFDEGSFAGNVRPWLGDVASIGVPSLAGLIDTGSNMENDAPGVLVALSITDRAAAETFFDAALGTRRKQTEGDFTVYQFRGDGRSRNALALGNEVALIALNDPDILPTAAPAAPLSAAPDFTGTLALLPEPDYNITLYLNLSGFFNAMTGVEGQFAMMDPNSAIFALLGAAPSQAWGFTILNDRSLTIDIAQPFGGAYLKRMEELGMAVEQPAPLDPQIAARIPANAALVIYGNDLGLLINSSLQNLQVQADLMGPASGFSAADLRRGLAAARVAVRAATGLDLETQLIPALSGNYALYAGLTAEAASAESPMALMQGGFPAEFGVLTEVTGDGVAAQIVTGLQDVVEAAAPENVTWEAVTLGDASGIQLTIEPDRSMDLPFPVELMLLATDNLLFFGTPGAAQASLAADGGLRADATFQAAEGLIVPSASQVWYMSGESLLPLAILGGMNGSQRDADNLRAALEALLESGTISVSTAADVNYIRAVWTLPE